MRLRARNLREILGGGFLLFLAWLVVLPLVLVLSESLASPGGGVTLDAFRLLLSRPTELRALWGSLWTSLVSVLLASAIGIPLALLFERFDFPGRRILGALVALPVVLPPLVGVVSFLFLYGEAGFFARLVRFALHLDEAPWRLEGAWAILLVHAYSMYVYFYLFTRAGLASLDPSLLEAAASLGAGKWRTARAVVFPHLRPYLAGASLLVFMTALASFSAPYVFGGGFRVMTTQIVSTRLNGDYRMAMAETVALTLVALAGLALLQLTDRGGGLSAGGRKGAARDPKPIKSRSLASLVTALGWGFAVFLLLPHLTVLLLSFVPLGSWTSEAIPPRYTLGNYIDLVREPERLRPLANSLWMAAVATIGAVAISLGAGILCVRGRVRSSRAIEAVLGLPWAVPGTVFAIALATMFGAHRPFQGRVVLIGTLVILPLAYLVRNLPLTSRAILSGFRSLDPSLGEAAASLGAGPLATLRRVTLPLLRPALAAGATLAFVTSLGDFVTSVLLYTWDTRPLSLEILASLRYSDVGAAAAYAVLLMVTSGLVFALGAERGDAGR
ncbi:MAG: iron ABC transporter permease [Acidobacteria bacterium]|nr:iron ABC transporter permease [Acidobacteriota bacterium]MCK6684934.1 iron ABC transporter permease [Thermoanaerobaculia bacterium]